MNRALGRLILALEFRKIGGPVNSVMLPLPSRNLKAMRMINNMARITLGALTPVMLAACAELEPVLRAFAPAAQTPVTLVHGNGDTAALWHATA